MKFVHLDHNNKKPLRWNTFSHDPYPDRVCILQSCNGLLLCRAGYYYIYNPTTNGVAIIDRNWGRTTRVFVSVLDFDPAKSPHYKLVFCVNAPSEEALTKMQYDEPVEMQFEVYSSETKTWKVSAQPPSIPPIDLGTSDVAYFQGCIYWICSSRHVNIMVYYNVDEEKLSTLPRPPHNTQAGLIRINVMRRNLYFGASAGHLHVVESFPCPATSIDVYELKCDRSGWFVKYKVDLTQLSKKFPEIISNKNYLDDEYAYAVQSLIRREDFDEDSTLVLEIPGKYIVYNLVDQSVKEVCAANNCRDAFSYIYRYCNGRFCGIYTAVDYIQSLAYV